MKLAEEGAVKAGRRILEVRRDSVIDGCGRDVKHRADLVSESILVGFLAASSRYSILTEERGEIGEINMNDPYWVIDPLDGTVNFASGIDFSCVSVALWQGDHPILGVVYDFGRAELFSGVVGAGAKCNNKPIFASHVKDPARAMLATGFPVNRDFSSEAIANFIEQIRSFRKIRLFGSAALSLAYVACGRVDAYTEEDIMFWDVAAGAALVAASSGYVSLTDSGGRQWAKYVFAGDVFRPGKGGIQHDSI